MGRTFALGDLHGQRGLWEKVKQYLAPDDKLYFLGDAIDRGPDGYKIMKELLLDERVVYIKGNHECMMKNALKGIQRHQEYGDWAGENLDLWILSNGGYSTFKEWYADGAMLDWINVIEKEMIFHAKYVNKYGAEIVLSHAGFTPGAMPTSEYDMVWDRHHFQNSIPKDFKDKDYIVVHGHTPTLNLEKELQDLISFFPEREIWWTFTDIEGACFYGEGHKIDIDTGSFATGRVVLLDLDELEVIPFDAPIEE